MHRLELGMAALILILAMTLVALGYNSFIQLIGSMAAGFLFGVSRPRT